MLDDLLRIFLNPEFYAAALRVATPLLLAAMAGLLAERAGILTFGMEGMMLVGAFFGVLGSSLTQNVWWGFVLAGVAGTVVALVYAVMVVSIGAEQVVSAVALNIFAFGLTSFLFSAIFGVSEVPMQVPRLSEWDIPLLSQLPIIGPIFFQQMPIAYLGLALLPITQFVLFRTSWGLNIRAVGEHPHAADTLGINVFWVRYITILYTGLMAGLGGAFLSIGQLGTFVDGMTAGRGFIAYTAIVFGKWTPIGTFLGCLLFGSADALQLRIQALNLGFIPYQALIAMPYILTLLILVFVVGRASWPAAYGQPFRREE